MQITDITAVVVNHRTQDLIERCVQSFSDRYPKVKMVLIDNGSRDASTLTIKRMAQSSEDILCILNEQNLFHGPGMDQGIGVAMTDYVFTLDSDCEVLRGGFLEEMLALFQDPDLYAVGTLMYMDRYGYAVQGTHRRKCVKYIHPYAMLLDRSKYVRLKRFVHHGSPCLRNMQDAAGAGYRVRAYPIEEYVRHEWRGTCSRFGYGLGPRTLIERMLSQLGLFT